MKQKKINNKNRAYTIIETMISVSLFLVVVMYGMGSLLNANLLQNKSQDMRSIMDNLSFVMEDMSKGMRTGYNYRCLTVWPADYNSSNIIVPKSGQSCSGIAFESSLGETSNPDDQIVYYVSSDNKIYKSSHGPYDVFPGNYIQLTPDEVVIDSFSKFLVLGAEPRLNSDCISPSNCQQPLITIILSGKITLKNITTPFSLQTSMSQRLIDV